MKNYLGLLVKPTISIFFLLAITFIALRIAVVYDSDRFRKEELTQLANSLITFGSAVWFFIRPFLQIIIILIIVDWILSKWGISTPTVATEIEWNVQTIIALIVVSAFSFAALTGIDESIGAPKDLALVVVGFYFGTQRKSVEVQTDKGKMTLIEEHDNEVRVHTKGEGEGKQDSA